MRSPNGARISRQWTVPIDDAPKAACVFEVIQQDARQGRAINQQDWNLASWTDDLELVGNNACGRQSAFSTPLVRSRPIGFPEWPGMNPRRVLKIDMGPRRKGSAQNK